MKINGTRQPTATQPTERVAARRQGQSEVSAGSATKVEISSDGAFLQGLRDEARVSPNVRTDEVERAKAEIADGSLRDKVDLDAVLDGLMADL